MARDPFRNYAFEVEIDGFTRLGFSKVSGLKTKTESIKYREGGMPSTPWQLPGQTEFEDVTLERGLMVDQDFANWARQIFDATLAGSTPPEEGWRRTVILYMKNKSGDRVGRYTIFNAWPKEFSLGDLDASANEVLVTTLVLANEGHVFETL